MAGALAWVNEMTDSSYGWASISGGHEYLSSASANALDPNLSKRYQVDLSSAGTSDVRVWEASTSASTVDISSDFLGIAGITFADDADREFAEFSMRTLEQNGGAVRQNTASGGDNGGWQAVDGAHGCLFWTFSAASTDVSNIEVRLRRSSGSWSGAWIGIGLVWAGVGLRWDNEPAINRDWTKRPVLNDFQRWTPGGGSKGRARARLQDTLLRIQDLQGAQMARAGQTLGAMFAHAGNSGPVALAIRAGESDTCAYGTLTQPPAPDHEYGDYWHQSIALRERR